MEEGRRGTRARWLVLRVRNMQKQEGIRTTVRDLRQNRAMELFGHTDGLGGDRGDRTIDSTVEPGVAEA
jgi:hypothetical protein